MRLIRLNTPPYHINGEVDCWVTLFHGCWCCYGDKTTSILNEICYLTVINVDISSNGVSMVTNSLLITLAVSDPPVAMTTEILTESCGTIIIHNGAYTNF